MMPCIEPPPPMKFISLTSGKEDCPRCGGRYLGRADLRCTGCGADFTESGLAHFRALPTAQARRI